VGSIACSTLCCGDMRWALAWCEYNYDPHGWKSFRATIIFPAYYSAIRHV